MALLLASGLWGCGGQKVKPIDLHDETIPLQARRLVADAEDSIDIARARLDEAERQLAKTRRWRTELLEREWPSEASSALPKLEELTGMKVALAERRVARADQQIDVARAKYRLITAKTAIRQDLAVYKLEPLRKRVDREAAQVDKLDDKIAELRGKVARLGNKWWGVFARFVEGGGDSRALFVGPARAVEGGSQEGSPKKRQKSSKKEQKTSKKAETSTSEKSASE
jgi:hypothetical protein